MENTNPRSYGEVVFTTIKDLIKNCEDKHDQLEKLQEKLQECWPSSNCETKEFERNCFQAI
jgi:hypothetical protein